MEPRAWDPSDGTLGTIKSYQALHEMLPATGLVPRQSRLESVFCRQRSARLLLPA